MPAGAENSLPSLPVCRRYISICACYHRRPRDPGLTPNPSGTVVLAAPQSPHPACLYRNILSLINEFEFPDQSVSREDYAAVLTHLNATQPERVAGLRLEACHLQDFLDKVLRGLASLQEADGGAGAWCTELGCAGLGSHTKGAPSPGDQGGRLGSAVRGSSSGQGSHGRLSPRPLRSTSPVGCRQSEGEDSFPSPAPVSCPSTAQTAESPPLP